MTQKEAVYALLRGEKPDVIINGWEPFQLVFDDVVMHTNPAAVDGKYVDCWGVTHIQEEGQGGAMPSEDPDLLACDDITEWKEQITVPEPEKWELDFAGAHAQVAAARANDKITLSFLPCGIFEESHNILGFEEALVDYLTEPEDMKELVEALFDVKLKCVKLQMENWAPDGFLMHDDWGSKDNLLLPPDVWREFFKEGYKKIFDYIHSKGKFVMVHSDSNNSLILEDMEEIGIDIWQGALPSVDIPKYQKELKKMVFMGGYDAGVIDRADTTDEELENEVKRVVREYLPGGRFIPCITYGAPGTLYPHVEEKITEVLNKIK